MQSMTILDWLRDVTTSDELEPLQDSLDIHQDPPPAAPSTAKATRKPTKRIALGEMSGNERNNPTETKPKSKKPAAKTVRGRSPEKKALNDEELASQTAALAIEVIAVKVRRSTRLNPLSHTPSLAPPSESSSAPGPASASDDPSLDIEPSKPCQNRSPTKSSAAPSVTSAPGPNPSDSASNLPKRSTVSEPTNKRDHSPAKTLINLEDFDQSIIYVPSRNSGDLPVDARASWLKVYHIAQNSLGIVPRGLKEALEKEEQMVFQHMLYTDLRSKKRQKDELSDIMKILAKARENEVEGTFEAQWNEDVHTPVLELALGQRDGFKRCNVTAASVIAEFRPTANRGTPTDSKVVDYAIARVGNLTLEIRNILRNVPDANRTINQVMKPRFDPFVLVIETKRLGGDEVDARVKLGAFMAAWRRRIELLVPDVSFIPMPGVMVIGNNWHLFWAIVRGPDLVEMHRMPGSIGETDNPLGCYKLLAVLRYLCDIWATEKFDPWFHDVLERGYPECFP